MVNKDVYINIAVNVLRGFNGVRRLRPALLTCKVVTFLVHRSNTGSDALPDATNNSLQQDSNPSSSP